VAAEPEALSIAVVHGPNLNLLGERETEWYGDTTLDGLDAGVRTLGRELGVHVSTFQANGEGALVDHVQAAAREVAGFIVNAGGYTHTSVALRDALLAAKRPFVEVHLSNVFAREPFRHRSLLADRALGVVCGFGPLGYALALRALERHLRTSRSAPATAHAGQGAR
jgi:3-dehydroquinate dehydratase-2